MKKLFVLALAAIGMVACVNEEITELPAGNEISFDNAFIDNATRAELTAGNLAEFGVWGYVDVKYENDATGQKATLFDGVTVTKTAGAWKYDGGARYWAPKQQHYFEAVAPLTPTAVAVNAASDNSGKVATIDYTVDGESDLIYAAYSKKAEDANNDNGPVAFTFNHLLSKVNFTFNNGFDANDGISIKVYNLKMTVPAEGTYTVGTGWNVDATTATTLENIEGAKFVLPYGNTYSYDIEFDVDVTFDNVVINKGVHKSAVVAGVAFEQGKAYNLTATIDSESLNMESIEFEVNEVKGFVPGGNAGFYFDPTSRTLTISTVEAFKMLNELNANWAAYFSNGLGTAYSNYATVNGGKGTDYYYKWDWTLKLNTDIDLENIDYVPTNLAGWGVFDGQGHTIKNVKITTDPATENEAGLFNCDGSCAIRNVVLDNVHVVGSLVGGSTAGILASDCHAGVDKITISNSSVWGGKYTGGVVGYGYTSVTNCKLTDCTVKGGYKLGGVIGYICSSGGAKKVDGHELIDCTVKGADGQYAGGKDKYIIGTIVGNYNCDGSCLNNTVSGMTTDAIANIGEIEAGKNVEGLTYYVNDYASLVNAVKKAQKCTIELTNNITVDEWVMFSETKTIGTGQIITVKMDGLTIDGKGHTLTVNDIESATNGDTLFDDATNLNIRNLTIEYAAGVAGGIGLKSGVISKVNFVGGVYGIYPGNGEIKVEDCTFATNADALYFEQERDNLTITGCTFNQPAGVNVVLLRGDIEFTNNIVNSGRTVNVVSGSPVVTGNNFSNVRFKVYSAATATISENTINNLAFEDGKTTYCSTFTNNTLSTAAQATLNAMTKM
ncbi:MAG: fimbrillin family protein [Tidjanibacter sp.]|nr:fimbrillin family protein [Tidjanibacter sp.]MBR3682969.1 fimbrillin family protein [Tidjanibacter sp.]MBR3853705.1 fimbrillin family protein [Tidjanibacter sp.]MBR7129400.1 fimbrillin family protein [Tidjanibacter sp.]